ncbi:glycoside hydrolase family 43 [Kribbella turkmenica]|uniref:Glycoside hydrolase family 43 n=1 Tax=Kribbella turkmenica TaxID=2530375 RepID=A0A4R4WQL9_9ACTN|nr:glycoside hydrolase family 43 protein [Kribbella turkmenica]TDD20074.1 glycoside hydrolase family 43 [Kribbella turkmenica]
MSFANPVYAADFADPAVLRAAGCWWAFATNGALGNVQVLRSDDLVRWTPVGDGLPNPGRWAVAGRTWAPEVTVHADQYVLYYTARVAGSDLQAIGRAVASQPQGPYHDHWTEPLIYQSDAGGSIDASPYTDSDGRRYLLWKNDGNAVGRDCWIYAQELTESGTALRGSPVRLMTHDQPWEGSVVEAPYLLRRPDGLHLFYSGNAVGSERYAVGHALCETPLGPCRKPATEPVLRSNDVAAGPGHCVVVEHDDKTWMVHHAWRPDDVRAHQHGRAMWVTEVAWQAGRPVCHGPSASVPSSP